MIRAAPSSSRAIRPSRSEECAAGVLLILIGDTDAAANREIVLWMRYQLHERKREGRTNQNIEVKMNGEFEVP